VRGDQHGAACVLAIVERQEKRAPLIPLRIIIAAQGEGAPAQLNHADKDAQQITQAAKRLEHTIRQRRDVGGEAHAQQIEGIHFAVRMCETDQIHGPAAAFYQRL
jgi:hypothetical protein